MKKISLYILLSLIISIIALEMTAFAATAPIENKAIKETTLIAADDTEVKPTIIPKPDFLPGPTETEQTKKGARKFLVEAILPYLAITFIGFVGGISLIFLVVGGVRLATAYGNEESIQKGKDQIIYAIVGLVVAILSYTIVTIVINLEFKKSGEETSSLPIEELIPGNGIIV